MRHTSSSITLGKVLWATLLACCLRTTLVVAAHDSQNSKSGDDNPQLETDVQKEDWNRYQLGRQGWSDIQGDWMYKRSVPYLEDQMGYYIPIEKKAWKNLQGGWGKRISPSEDELNIQELASMLEREDNQNIPRIDFDVHEDEKRSWDQFSEGWGKRNKWDKFGGSWGKRHPDWSKLKGIWGKRSVRNQFAN